MQRTELEKYILALVSPLLTNPEEASCTHVVDDMGTLFTLKISKQDMGQVIGKSGATVTAIRHMVRSAGLSHGIRASLKIPDF